MALATRPKRNTTSHKKRAGKHHRQSDAYLKHYWPYIPMLIIVGLGLLFNGAWNHGGVLGAQQDFSATSLLANTNEQRVKDHETSLTLNQQLVAAAQAKANDMAQRNYWSHDTPDGQTPWAFVTSAGYNYQATGENLAYGFAGAKDTVAGWMNSRDHRANILNENYSDVGFGVAQSPNYQGKGPATIVVAEYAQPAGATLGAAQSAPVISPVSQTISRAQLITGQSAWITIVVSALAGAAAAIFFVRHGMYIKRLVMKSELFVIDHPLLDITILFIGALAIIFMQASGTIH